MRRTVIVFAVISFACHCPAACARAEEVARGPSTDPALEAFKSREGFRFGVGGECAGGGVAFDVRAFARLNYAASPALELHADLLVGGSFVGPFLLAGLRGDVQLDLGSIIALSAGVDLAVSTGENGIMPGVEFMSRRWAFASARSESSWSPLESAGGSGILTGSVTISPAVSPISSSS